MSNAAKSCGICNNRHGGEVWIISGFICKECLQQISQTKLDQPIYEFYVSKLKKLWQAG